MLFRTSSLLALACAACSTPRPAPVPSDRPANEPAVSAPGEPAGNAAPAAQPTSNKPESETPTQVPSSTATPPRDATNESAAASTPALQLSEEERELRAQVHRAVDAGDYARASALLDDYFTVPVLAKARVLLEQGRPEEALVLTEQAVSHAPGEPRALIMHGEACLRSGLRARDKALIERARLAFVKAGALPSALLGASHAARELGRAEEALQLARDGFQASQAPGASDSAVPPCELAELTVARALWDAYGQERIAVNASATPIAVTPLFTETEGALSRLVERAPSMAWGWHNLGELYEGASRLEDAQRVLERGANALPDDALINVALARVTHQRGGNAAVLTVFERLELAHPSSPLPWWFAGRARFDEAVATLPTAPAEAFRRAESEFDKCIARGSTQLGSAAQYQARCRSALGLLAVEADKLDEALATFRSIATLYPGALFDEPTNGLPSGARGKELVGEAYKKRDDLPRAAPVYVELHSDDPRRLVWATNAGLVSRDAGEALQIVASDCALAADGKITDARRIEALRERVKIKPDVTGYELRDEFKRRGQSRKEAAKRHFNTSWQCYRDATDLAPDDIRLLNDCAVVAVYHTGTDLEVAERMLQRCIALGADQVKNPSLSDEQRLALTEAWGDAHQNLGKLYLEKKDDAARAKVLFEQSVKIGPYPRPAVTDSYLPKCERRLRAKHP